MDVDNVETTYFDKCAFFAAFDSFLLSQFCFSETISSMLGTDIATKECWSLT